MSSQGKGQVAEDPEVFLELPRKMNNATGASLRMDAHEADGMIQITAEVPGVPESAIDISLDGDVLTISFDKRDPNHGKRIHFSERSYGRFERSFQMPFAPDADTVQATIEHGLLTISFPRVDRDRTRHIAVNGGHPAAPDDPSAFVAGWADPPPKSEPPLTVDVTATRVS